MIATTVGLISDGAAFTFALLAFMAGIVAGVWLGQTHKSPTQTGARTLQERYADRLTAADLVRELEKRGHPISRQHAWRILTGKREPTAELRRLLDEIEVAREWGGINAAATDAYRGAHVGFYDQAADEGRLVYCTFCGKTHAARPGERPCAPGAWLDPAAIV